MPVERRHITLGALCPEGEVEDSQQCKEDDGRCHGDRLRQRPQRTHHRQKLEAGERIHGRPPPKKREEQADDR